VTRREFYAWLVALLALWAWELSSSSFT